jgi:hypothetical protein
MSFMIQILEVIVSEMIDDVVVFSDLLYDSEMLLN